MTSWLGMVTAAYDSDRPKVASEGSTMSGRELLSRAAAAADWLDDLDIPVGGYVPALISNRADSLALLIGAVGSGRVLAPLGPRLTPREIAQCAGPLGVGVIVAEQQASEVAARVARDIGCAAATLPPLPESGRKLWTSQAENDPVILIHTSGTTGMPKPVLYRDRHVLRRALVSSQLMELSERSTYLTASPFHHVGGVGNLLVGLAVGATLVPFPRFRVQAWRALANVAVTHAQLVPTMIEMLLESGELRAGTLQVIQYGAAPIHPDTLRRTVETVPNVRLLNMFGQTEGSPITYLSPEDHRRAVAGETSLLSSVGRAVPGVELRIQDPDVNGLGEVLARAEHFVHVDDEGWLHTGDIGRLAADGYLYLRGRLGDKIVRGGENVYPIEVEQVLAKHPGVADVAVIGVPDRRLGETVKAFVVAADQTDPPSPDSLRAFAREHLAGFKVPSDWEFVTSLPRNHAGKIMRRLLSEGSATRSPSNP
ncbi:fatty acid--CoA ligase family protein [Mycobacterium sp. CVI_P3]|uniref:Fatty acid--CoA ligase family protein n=1 Tax=Mycobacterium pinniadriaticum TaxID=2994102 RepID=A0ABT3SDB1_9MYCO|nr:fatty acid--CoA ligase family protein [Mycobacterium pinniadriaticum]MCX2931275.1 fatty acid--CoA ligase family protein [Mycobacterium pinniadriaticum]MCX2937501.1 fatty acid--CoA ligase family protein [Mycobacterium pinniadriaticum]